MEWFKSFYDKQNQWYGVYLKDISDTDMHKIKIIEKLLPEKGKILELGAGGGQLAISLAIRGYDVTIIEYSGMLCEHAQQLNKKYNTNINIIQGDFFKTELDSEFDLICYMDSFGIGDDTDQIILLNKVEKWLKVNAKAVIEIGSSSFWSNYAINRVIDLGIGGRKYNFDYINSRLIDCWWLYDNPEEIIFQSLRCYNPADFLLLLNNTKLNCSEFIFNNKNTSVNHIDYHNSDNKTYFAILNLMYEL